MPLTQNRDSEGVSDSISLRGRKMKSDREAPRWTRPIPSPSWCSRAAHGRVWDQGGLWVRRNPASNIMMDIVTRFDGWIYGMPDELRSQMSSGNAVLGGGGSRRFRRDQHTQRLAERRFNAQKPDHHRINRLDIMMDLVTVPMVGFWVAHRHLVTNLDG